MPGDYSRLTHEPDKHYSSVRMQQGRVQLDSDWNEQADIVRHALETTIQDLLGRAGALAEGHGFEIIAEPCPRVHPPQFTIGPGHFYVDGMLCTNDAPVQPLRAEAQPHYPPARSAAAGPPAAAHAGPSAHPEPRPDAYLVYLDAWQQEVTAVEDGDLQEVALGSIDTTARLKTVWQVKLHPLPEANPEDSKRVSTASRNADSSAPEPGPGADAVAAKSLEPEAVMLADSGSRAAPLELSPHAAAHSHERRARQAAEVKAWRELAAQRAYKPRPADKPDVANEWKAFLEAANSAGTLEALLPRPDIMTVENQLYRVEVHTVEQAVVAAPDAAPSGAALTFKWSRDNGSVAFAITKIVEADTPAPQAFALPLAAAAPSDTPRLAVTLRDPGSDPLALQASDWVEIVDDIAALRGQTLPLVQVESVDWARKQVVLTLGARLSASLLEEIRCGNPRLRRWDRKIPDSSATKPEPALLPVENGWIELENELQVCFDSKGTYRPGDYWVIPTRVGQPLSWPEEDGGPKALPPHGPQHHYALLAVLRWEADGWHVEDCRELHETTTRLTERLNKLEARVEAEVEVLHQRISDEVELLEEQLDDLTEKLDTTRHDLNHLRSQVIAAEDRINVLEGYLPDEKTRLFQDCITDAALAVGDVVALDPDIHNHVLPGNRGNARQVYGVVHHLHEKGRQAHKKEGLVHVVIYGRTRCKVIGHVEPGDLLVPSHVDGCARKAGLGALLHPGTVLGKALGRHGGGDDDEPGHIDVVVTLG